MSADGKFRYEVQDGDTIWSISQRWKCSESELLWVNGLDNDTPIQVGWKLFIPVTPTPSPMPTSTPDFKTIENTKVVQQDLSDYSLSEEQESQQGEESTVPWLIYVAVAVFVLALGALGLVLKAEKNRYQKL